MTSPIEKKRNLSFQEIIQPYKKGLDQVNKVLESRYSSSLPLIKEIGTHHFRSGGKRIRPLLTLIFCHILGASSKRAANLAACVELIHAASLLHDDVLDEGTQRRGSPSVNVLWNNRISILAGDYLFSQAFSCMVEDGAQQVYQILSGACINITEGELYQISIQRDLNISFSQYEYMVEKKTASLFQAACSIGGAIVGSTQEEKENLKNFGRIFGYIFQMIDDFLDYMGDAEVLGKALGKDLEEGKITFPVLYTYQKSTKEEKIFWQEIFHKDYIISSADLRKVRTLLEKYKTEQAISSLLEKKKEQALKALLCFSPCENIKALENLLNFVIDRRF